MTRLPINDEGAFEDEFYAAATARGWTVEEDGSITIPGGGLTVVSDPVTFDPTTGEVHDEKPSDIPTIQEGQRKK